MNKAKKDDEMTTVVMASTREEFFARGRAIAKALDAGKPVAKQRIISFEDPKDLAKFLASHKLNLVEE